MPSPPIGYWDPSLGEVNKKRLYIHQNPLMISQKRGEDILAIGMAFTCRVEAARLRWTSSNSAILSAAKGNNVSSTGWGGNCRVASVRQAGGVEVG